MVGREMVLTAAAVLMFAAPAKAQTTDTATYFAQFDRFCLSTGADPAAAVAAAEAEGWIAAPQAMVDEIVNPNAPEVVIRLSGPAEGSPARLIISTSSPQERYGGLRARSCGIEPALAEIHDGGDLAGRIAARLGFVQAGPPIWMFSGEDPFTEQTALMFQGREAATAFAATQPLFMLTLMPRPDGQGSFVGLLRLTH